MQINDSATVTHFVASGTLRSSSFGPLPQTFWACHLQGDAFWNNLQLAIDRHHNPVLRPNNSDMGFENATRYETLLRPNSSNVADRNSSGRNFDKLPQQMQHFVSHMEIRDYPILIQPDGVCGAGAKYERERPLLLMAIKSTELNLENRQAIRRTWGKAGRVAGQKGNSSRGAEGGAYVRRVFLLGKEPPEGLNEDFPGLLRMESKLYGDILQWDFEDTFFNLTLKDVLFWSWFSGSCGRTRFVFKGDDDVFVNTPKLITYLQDQLKEPQARDTMKGFMVGNVIGAASPVRVNSSKYFIPVSFYKGLYPAYAGGGGVVYSSLLTKRLLNTSKRVLLFPIDDVYVGMCMVRLNLCPSHHPAFLTFDFPAKEEEQPCAYHRVLLVHKRSPSEMVTLWAGLKKTATRCRDVPLRNTPQH